MTQHFNRVLELSQVKFVARNNMETDDFGLNLAERDLLARELFVYIFDHSQGQVGFQDFYEEVFQRVW